MLTMFWRKRFQSTLPVRGATTRYNIQTVKPSISIHAPREGSDLLIPLINIIYLTFQSTLPVRGATFI